MGLNFLMDPRYFNPDIFQKVFAVVMILVFIGFAIAYYIHGELLLRDVLGSLISGTLLAYLVHLWLMPNDDY